MLAEQVGAFLERGLQKVRQRAGHGRLEVTSRYAAIPDERDTSLAEALEEISDGSRAAAGLGQTSAELDDAAELQSGTGQLWWAVRP